MALDEILLGNTDFVLTFDLNDGIRLTRMKNLITGEVYLQNGGHYGNPFGLRIVDPATGNPNYLHSGVDFSVTSFEQEDRDGGQHLQVTAVSSRIPIETHFSVTVPPTGPVSDWQVQLKNLGDEKIQGEAYFPLLCGVVPGGDVLQLDACLPIQLGGIHRRFIKSHHPLLYAFPHSFVEDAHPTYGSPFALPFVNLLRGDQTEGVFLLVKDPTQRRFSLALTTIGDPVVPVMQVGFDLDLARNEEASLPIVAVGVHRGDWHSAVAAYRNWVGERFEPVNVPSWFREAGAIYGVGGVGGGGGFLAGGMLGSEQNLRYSGSLATEISSFEDLPVLLEQAQQMGTNVLYLWDYWDGEAQTGMPPYWNKGDYRPRQDLGGGEAFRRGVAKVHAQGGRVLVYVEGFIVYKNSQLGQARGRDMALMNADGGYYEDYDNYWSMCPADRSWQDTLVEICQRLVAEYDLDGIFLDSIGAQWNHPCFNPQHSHWPDRDRWNAGVTTLVDRVRTAIRQIKPDAIVMTESSCDLLLPFEDGACDGSFIWHAALNADRLLGSPYKTAYPRAAIFSNGHTLSQMNQVYAHGANLAIGPGWKDHADDILQLVEMKRRYRDALIDTREITSLPTSCPEIVANAFLGAEQQVVLVVNLGAGKQAAMVRIPSLIGGSEWIAPLSGERQAVRDRQLSVNLPGGGLQVWVVEPAKDDQRR